MGYRFKTAGQAFFGEDALEMAGPVLGSMGKKALIVTGKIVTKSGMTAVLTDELDKQGVKYSIFSDLPGEPDDLMVKAGAALYEKEGCDFIIGLGGGTPLDSAKAIGMYVTNHEDFIDLVGKNAAGDFPPLAAIPTTAGTGSEVTKFICLTDSASDTKILLGGDDLIPDLAIINPAFTLSAPGSVTAATGMDALTHAVESYTSRKGNPVTDLYAEDAIKKIFTYLPAAYKDGSDKEARSQMAIAAYEAGVCINNASVTLVHGMSRPIGALFHVPHGISNAMLIGECLTFALEGCPDRFAALARLIGKADESADDKKAAKIFIDAIKELADTLDIPTLEGYGIDREAFFEKMPKMAKDAITSGSPANTIRPVSEQDVLDIYAKLWQ